MVVVLLVLLIAALGDFTFKLIEESRMLATQQAQEGLADLVVAGGTRSTTRHDDEVAWLDFGTCLTQDVAQDALDPVTPDGVRINLAGNRQTQPGRPVSRQPVQGHQRIGHTAGAVEDR